MEISKLLLEGYLVFGIIVTYGFMIIIGMLIGQRAEEERIYKDYEQQIQSKKEKFDNGTKFEIME